MGTILFLILRLIGRIDFGEDLIILCFLVSLDSIALSKFLSKEE